ELTGADAEKWLEQAGIITHKNGIPNDPRPPKLTSGLRLGTPALTTRGMGEGEMRTIGGWMLEVLKSPDDAALAQRISGQVKELCQQFPVPAAALD
ncbi:MAG: serine hydroxymethyltransferase, partial [Planctomycetales bacterium]|nr:serine hydroxymethyltransferase [Planctomycetales bacterium]